MYTCFVYVCVGGGSFKVTKAKVFVKLSTNSQALLNKGVHNVLQGNSKLSCELRVHPLSDYAS